MPPTDPYSYTVRLADTDAARVVYFASILRICHEAYENALVESNIDLRNFLANSNLAIPVVACEARFFIPMYCGDRLWIFVRLQSIETTEFQLNYTITPARETGKVLAKASTRHVCIDIQSRERQNLPDSWRSIFS